MSNAEPSARDVVLRAVLPPSTCGRFPGIPQASLPGFWATLERAAPLSLRVMVWAAVAVCVVAPVFVGLGLRRFERLSPPQQDVVLARLAASEMYALRQCVTVLKLCASFAAFSQTAVPDAAGAP